MTGLCCCDCGADKLIGIWPGSAGVDSDLFHLIPERQARGWCETCWLKRYGAKPALPLRGSKAASGRLTKD